MGIAHAELVRQGLSDRAGDQRALSRHDHPDASHVVSLVYLQRLDAAKDVLPIVHRVAIHPHDHPTASLGDSDIQGRRRNFLGILEQSYEGVVQGIEGDDAARPVLAHPIDHQDLEAVLGIIVVEDRVKTRSDELFLVAAGNHNRNSRQVIHLAPL